MIDVIKEPSDVRLDDPPVFPVVQRLTQLLNDIIANGRSTAGAPQKNDVPVIVAKPNRKAAKE